ncbi:hypothetical protein PCE1_004754 [Barthelona sp. PCE]
MTDRFGMTDLKVVFAQKNYDFRLGEFLANAKRHNVDILDHDDTLPTWDPILNILVSTDDVHNLKKVVNDCLLVRYIYREQFYGTEDQFHAYIRENTPIMEGDNLMVDNYQREIDPDLKKKIFHACGDPKLGEETVYVCRTVQYNISRTNSFAGEDPDKFMFSFGILECEQGRNASQAIIGKLALNRRPFIGTTSLDPLWALLMCRIARVKPGSVVYDCFCGTGSVIITAAMLGAHVIGTELDVRWLNGRIGEKYTHTGEVHTVADNFKELGLPEPVVARGNAAYPVLRSGIVDAIICDPPYGKRVGIGHADGGYVDGWMSCMRSSISLIQETIFYQQSVLKLGGLFLFLAPHPTIYPFTVDDYETYCKNTKKQTSAEMVEAIGNLQPISRSKIVELFLPTESNMHVVGTYTQTMGLGGSRTLVVLEKRDTLCVIDTEDYDERCEAISTHEQLGLMIKPVKSKIRPVKLWRKQVKKMYNCFLGMGTPTHKLPISVSPQT